jgi:hypothetical protein
MKYQQPLSKISAVIKIEITYHEDDFTIKIHFSARSNYQLMDLMETHAKHSNLWIKYGLKTNTHLACSKSDRKHHS